MTDSGKTPEPIHMSILGGRGQGVCGKWTPTITEDARQVTCRSCLRCSDYRMVAERHRRAKGKVYPVAPARTAVCEECDKEFAKAHSRQRFCTPECCNANYARKLLGLAGSKLAPATRGAVSEMVAACDLLERGYEVFRALSAACSCDLIALGPDQVPLRIEVRTGRFNTSTGNLTFSRNKARVPRKRTEDDLDHYAVVVGASVVYEPPLPGDVPDAGGASIADIRRAMSEVPDDEEARHA